MKYLGSVVITYKLKALTGLRVGGSRENFDIGGVDNPVMKVPVSIPDFYGEGKELPAGAPYIPGSSVKGKIRSLLEWVYGRVDDMIRKSNGDVDKAGKPCDCGRCEVCIVFGTGDANTLKNLSLEEQPGPPRSKFFDAYPTEDTLTRLQEELGKNIFTEIKTENQINRITSAANPRKVERVPAGAVFEGTIVFDLFKEEDRDKLRLIFDGMKRLEDNFLGGYGSRGSGKVRFEDIKVVFRPADYYKGKAQEKEIGNFRDTDEVLQKFEEIKGKCS
ncbi:MAG: type III-A CRISPR-associated RAMP protein Csm3 [Hydrogenobacter thermophilus]|uniref:type III-A CRISPR-associated RAMP protein Csm3 n=1 Tax=Hydrogenobacter thermophilus TaxID=940 RepID=UPI001C771DAD|nr:type III-A CRISPR-associated RAMP protein Csm3 [Hydrogenobacter thermophilus]QWK20607.1 MAG: type III-A CRISPR-associated RAMP protein Csm3 [Hydrogenobacter thermophilus]